MRGVRYLGLDNTIVRKFVALIWGKGIFLEFIEIDTRRSYNENNKSYLSLE